jgi:hypothetical protein
MNIEDSRIIARFQCLLTESIVAKRLGQSRPDSKDALYQMLFEELEQRGLKGTPEYRNVMFRADQHAEWLAGLARLEARREGTDRGQGRDRRRAGRYCRRKKDPERDDAVDRGGRGIAGSKDARYQNRPRGTGARRPVPEGRA